jgi:CheY-like chemotaxis protein
MAENPEDAPHKPKVLVIDDDWDLVLALLPRLKAAGFAVEVAQDGEIGLERAAVFQPDVILLDLLMPMMDGWEVARQIHKNPLTREVPLLAMTGLKRPGADENLHSIGIKKVIVKPFDLNRLVDLLKGSLS